MNKAPRKNEPEAQEKRENSVKQFTTLPEATLKTVGTLARLQAVEKRHSGPISFRCFREGKLQFPFASEIWDLPLENG